MCMAMPKRASLLAAGCGTRRVSESVKKPFSVHLGVFLGKKLYAPKTRVNMRPYTGTGDWYLCETVYRHRCWRVRRYTRTA